MKPNIELALAEAKKKYEAGLLVWDEIPELPDKEMKEWWHTPKGDKETIYSIASLFSSENVGGEGTEDEILEVLMKEYPKHW